MLYGPKNKVKIIDFGKCTLVTDPIIYDLSPTQSARYNDKHRYLAHELRNIPHSKQTAPPPYN